MTKLTDSAHLAAALAATTGMRVAERPEAAVGGGSINECVRWPSESGALFVKLTDADRHEMFAAEAEGLRELERARTVRVPRVLGEGTAAGRAFLALEWIEFGRSSPRSEALLGEQLAALHRVTARQFGWHRDNTIGATPQHNDWLGDWPAFYARQRLGF
jgi:fructosamine-3-kinase